MLKTDHTTAACGTAAWRAGPGLNQGFVAQGGGFHVDLSMDVVHTSAAKHFKVWLLEPRPYRTG